MEVIDGADAAAERLEEECEIAIGAAEIEHGMVADQRFEKAAAAVSNLSSRVSVPKLSQGYQPGSGGATSLFAWRRRS